MFYISDKKKEASVYGAVAIIIIFVVGLFSEILLGVGTRLAIAWPMVSVNLQHTYKRFRYSTRTSIHCENGWCVVVPGHCFHPNPVLVVNLLIFPHKEEVCFIKANFVLAE